DPLAAALSGLTVALSGGGGAGEGASGRSSRLYRALVDPGLATESEASFSLMKDPYLFWVEASLRPGVPHAAVEAVLLEQLARIAAEPLGDDELARVRRQMLAGTAYPTDTTTGRAYQLGQLLSSGAARSIGEWYDRLAAVTAEDLQAAAAATFVERSRTVGWYVPEPA
ncbi:MAG: insulinase family protein, partial [Chloroflexota bacterium]|nr:insulinase family protein [Chloroflexota bacterium]